MILVYLTKAFSPSSFDKYQNYGGSARHRISLSFHQKRMIFYQKSYCKICGVKLPHGSQKFCLECLLKSYKGDDIEKYRHARNILYCRGYDRAMIEDECEERGII